LYLHEEDEEGDIPRRTSINLSVDTANYAPSFYLEEVWQ